MNPWWEGNPLPPLPTTRRHLVEAIHRRVRIQLAPIVVVRGPRQIGKTVAQQQVVQDLLDQGVHPSRLLRMQCDELPELSRLTEPIPRVVDWYESAILGRTLNRAARDAEPAFLFFDEVQNIKSWAPQLKALVDASSAHVVVTGSSALRIERGRDSLAGRISTIEVGVLSLTEIGNFHGIDSGPPFLADNGLESLTRQDFWSDLAGYGRRLQPDRDRSFAWFSERGGYPIAHKEAGVPWNQIADQLNETVIQKVIRHDLRVGERGRRRDEQLLEEVYRLACRYAGQAPGLTVMAREVGRALHTTVGTQRVNHYLKFLAETLLLWLIDPLEIRLKKKRGNSKICLADHGLRASSLQESIPLDPDRLLQEPQLTVLAGHIAESATGATLLAISGLDLAYQPERGGEPEVDFILTIGTKRIPLEVKYQRRIDPMRDTEGLRAFVEKRENNAPFGILVTQIDGVSVTDPRIVTLPLSSLMLLR
ncbi:MAG: AAA family ATPase [Candidatus Zixiibacteriota bacterium]